MDTETLALLEFAAEEPFRFAAEAGKDGAYPKYEDMRRALLAIRAVIHEAKQQRRTP